MPTSAMSESETTTSSQRQSPDPYRKEQDSAIIEIFAEAEHPVLSTAEVEDELDNIGMKQTRRRLYDLADEGILQTRKPARDRVWWLDEEVEEPITVRYPLLRFVRDRSDVLLAVIGGSLGLVGALAVTLGLGLEGTQTSLPFISNGDILLGGLYLIAGGIPIMIAGIVMGILSIGLSRLTESLD